MQNKTMFFAGAVLVAILVNSCSESKHEEGSYFSVDSQKYPVYIANINDFGYPNQPEVGFTGAASYYVTLSVRTPDAPLSPGTYKFEYVVSSTPQKITFMHVRYSGIDLTSDVDSVGTLTVSISGDIYTLDFTGTILTHKIVAHWVGKAKIN